MAKKPFISVDGITVGEANALVNVILANGDITTNNITVSNNANLGNVGNVIITGGSSGYVLSTNGSGNLNWVAQSGGGSSNISNGNSNVNIATANGNVTISVAGTSNVVNVTGSNVFVTANIIPTANITYDLGTSTNRFRDLYLSGNTINLGNSNLSANGTQLILTNPLGGEFIVGGNGIVNSADLTGYSIANGNSNVSVVANGNIAISSAGNANILIVTGTGANINGTANITGNVTLSGANVSLGAVGNVIITGGSNGQYLQTNGSGVLTWSTVTSGSTSNISNGNSNVNIPAINGNVNISAVGNANILVITGTGANITGTLSVTGNANVDNLGATGIYATTLAGALTTAAQPNITSIGTLSSLSVTGNANTGNLGTTNFIATGTGSFGANVNLNSFNITNLATPNASTDAATKQYVDDVAQGLNVHDAAAAATPDTLANVTSGTITYNNGSSGVGANLTTTGTFNLIDGVNVQTSGTRILVKNEANAVHNGIYTWSNATVITRATDYNSVPEVEAGDFVFVTGGTVYDNTGWVQTSTVSAIGTPGNNIEFTQFSGAGTYQAGTGLTLTGSTFSVNASQTQVTSVGTLTSLAVTGNITSGNANLGNNVSANFFTGNGIYLTGITTAGISNGNSNVSIPSSNGNVNISAVGNANVLVITGTGANITGTLGVTGNITAGNISAGSGTGGSITGGNLISANYITGTLTTAAQPNITSVGTLTSLSVTGNITSGNANLGNNVTANFFTGNGSLLTGITVSAGNSIVNGNSNVLVTANGNVTTSVAGNANILIVTGTGANILGTLNVTGNTTVANLSTSGSGGNISNVNVVSANTFTASGNVTAGNASLGNATTANFFIGSGNNLSNIQGSNVTGAVGLATFATTANAVAGANVSGQVTFAATANTVAGANVSGQVTFAATANSVAGANVTGAVTYATTANSVAGANVSGQVANALVSGTVYTNAQPNITTVGSLLGLTVSNATGVVNFTTTANIALGPVSNVHITGGSNGQYLQTDGSGNLSWSTVSTNPSNISNGNSNVSISTANGNITMSAVGNANIVTVTGTGANISGTLNTTGNVTFTGSNISLGNVGNVRITGGTANYVLKTDGAGNLDWVAQSGGNAANVTVDNFTGNGVQTIFTLSTTPIGINQTSVNYNGATVLRTDYTLANANITFSSAPANGSLIEVTTINLTSGGGGGGITAQDLLSPFLLMGA